MCLSLLQTLVFKTLRQLLHDDQDAVQDCTSLGDVDDDSLVFEHFDAPVLECFDVVETFLRRMFYDVADGCT